MFPYDLFDCFANLYPNAVWIRPKAKFRVDSAYMKLTPQEFENIIHHFGFRPEHQQRVKVIVGQNDCEQVIENLTEFYSETQGWWDRITIYKSMQL